MSVHYSKESQNITYPFAFCAPCFFVFGKRSQDRVEDWKALSKMSKTVAAAVQSDKIVSYHAACAAKAALRDIENVDEYSLLDLTCYTCLRH